MVTLAKYGTHVDFDDFLGDLVLSVMTMIEGPQKYQTYSEFFWCISESRNTLLENSIPC